MTKARLILTVLGLLVVASLTLVRPAAAHDCDIFINPDDCQNTAWTIGVIATLAGGVTVAVAATLAANRDLGEAARQEPADPGPLPVPPTASGWHDQVEVRTFSDPPSVTIHPPDGVVRSYSVRIESHRGPGSQTIREVNREHD